MLLNLVKKIPGECVSQRRNSQPQGTQTHAGRCVYRCISHADVRSASLLIAEQRALEFDALGRLRSQIIRTCARDEGRSFRPIVAHLSLWINICLFIRILRPRTSANKNVFCLDGWRLFSCFFNEITVINSYGTFCDFFIQFSSIFIYVVAWFTGCF